MTKKHFIKTLEDYAYIYSLSGDRIIVEKGTSGDNIMLGLFKTIPSNITFKNDGYVDLSSIKDLPKGIVFDNHTDVYLENLKTIPPDTVFKNKGVTILDNLRNIPKEIQFTEDRDVIWIGKNMNTSRDPFYVDRNMSGIRVLNMMIRRGVL